MSRIAILPETVSNKIAAGEVVERPASVVKELVENSIDAKSTQVSVEINKGGRAFIRVCDNGMGMDSHDARLSIERHATSKIHDEKELFSIHTLGFRGEALPSIASVSNMEMVTRSESSDTGTRIVVRGGTIQEVSEVGAPKGTMIAVNRLFFNTPARRKFLKTDRTETGHISDTITRGALAWPGIQFKFFHNGRHMANWGSTKEHLHRVVDVLGNSLDNNLYEMDYKNGNIRISGFIGSPSTARPSSSSLYMYVNDRFVRDKLLHHAIMEGYAGRLMKGNFPVVVLFVSIPPDEVDVNVHPTKSSVRFEAPGKVHDTIVRGVSTTLNRGNRPKWGPAPFSKAPQGTRHDTLFSSRAQIREPQTPNQQSFYGRPPKVVPSLWDEKPFSALRVVGQLHNTYIVCESEEGLVLVDQHAAHERIVFESLKSDYSRSQIASQGMLVPERLELSHREASILDTLLQDMADLGIDIEPFGARTYLVRAVPTVLAGKAVKPLVMDIIGKAADIGVASGIHHEMDEYLSLMACHGAIRAKERLSHEEMKTLLKQLDTLDNPSHCPHGRPTFICKTLPQMEKEFGRIV